MTTHIPYDWLALRMAYTMSRHEPLRIYLGDFRWSVYTVERAIAAAERRCRLVLP